MPLDVLRSWWQRRTRWEQACLIVWPCALLLLCLPSVFEPRQHSVYPVYEAAGQNWLHGEDLYPTPDKPKDLLYRYSPLVAAWFAPWSQLPDRLANPLWRLLNAGVFLAGLWWYCRRVLPEALSRDQRAAIFLLTLPLAGVNVFNGQCNLLVLGLILLCGAWVATQRWNLAAAALAGACLLKVYPMALGLLLMALYPRRFAPRFLLALAVGAVLPCILQDPHYVVGQYGYWLSHMDHNDRHSTEFTNWFRDLRLLLYVGHIDLSYTGYLLVEALLGAFVALFCAAVWLSSVSSRALLNLVVCLSCCWMTVFGPSTESCTYCLAAPALAWLLVDRARHPAWLWAESWCAFALLCAPVFAGWIGLQHEPFILPWQPLGGVVLFICLLGAGIEMIRATRRNWNAPADPCLQVVKGIHHAQADQALVLTDRRVGAFGRQAACPGTRTAQPVAVTCAEGGSGVRRRRNWRT